MLDKSGIYEGRKTAKIIEKHKRTVVEAFNLFMSKVMKTSLDFSITKKEENKTDNKPVAVTTKEEIQGYAIITAILYGTIDITRLYFRDNASYFNILLDDNILKTVCRLYLNKSNKYIAFLETRKNEKSSKEEKYSISDVNDIFKFKEQIINRVAGLEKSYAKK